MKRKNALNLIEIEYAKHGEITAISMQAYAESQISFAAYTDSMKTGLKIFNDRRNKEDENKERN